MRKNLLDRFEKTSLLSKNCVNCPKTYKNLHFYSFERKRFDKPAFFKHKHISGIGIQLHKEKRGMNAQ